jgi:hypothetical protein
MAGLHGSYPETAFDKLIEANRGGTWAINAVCNRTQSISSLVNAAVTGEVDPKSARQMSRKCETPVDMQ